MSMFSFRFTTNLGLFFLLCFICAFVFVSLNNVNVHFDLGSRLINYLPCDDEYSIAVPLNDIMKSPVSLSANEPKLIKRIHDMYLHEPNLKEAYNLSQPKLKDPSMGQSLKILEILGEKHDGFFIECGALDGETRSNTLYFERYLGWKGVIIEGDPSNFKLLIKKNRKAHSVDACLSTDPYPKTVMFRQQFNLGKISDTDPNEKESKPGLSEVQCLPLYSILLAVGVTEVDYFSLDVEGNELEVLRTIPWDKVKIKTLSVEFIHGKEGKDALRDYMVNQGYEVHSEVTHPHSLANDFIFYHPKLV